MQAGAEPIEKKNLPTRTCVGCRTREPKSTLLRVVLANGRPVLDSRLRLAGRGAYIHRTMSCLDRATKRGGLARALRASVDPVSFADFRQSVMHLLDRATYPSNPQVPSGSRGPQDTENRRVDRLTQADPRFVDVTPQPKGQR